MDGRMTNEHFYCPKCWNDLDTDYYEAYRGKCSKCKVDLSKFACRYGKDHGEGLTIEEFLDGLAKLIDKDTDIDTVVDYIDEYFIFGSWGFRVGMDVVLVRDLRGIIVAAYKRGKEANERPRHSG
jgi:hypothetical protein